MDIQTDVFDKNILPLLNLFAHNKQKHHIFEWLKQPAEASTRLTQANALLNHPGASPVLKSAIKELLSEHPGLR